jgi:VanZ family protein
MNLKDVYIPVLLLVSGGIISALFRSAKRSKPIGNWQWWIPVFLYALFIFSLSNRSYPHATPCFSTKIFHPIEYMVLAIFLCLPWFTVPDKKGLFSFSVRVISAGILYGASDELHQAFIPGRSARVTDVVFWDLLGITIGLGIFLLIRRLIRTSFNDVEGTSF